LLLLLVAAALHLGFQLTVTVLVYPAFAEVPTQQWRAHHVRHSRRITPVVIVVYGLLSVACGWVLLDRPGVLTVAAVGACTLAGGLTATVAAPAQADLPPGAIVGPCVGCCWLTSCGWHQPPWRWPALSPRPSTPSPCRRSRPGLARKSSEGHNPVRP